LWPPSDKGEDVVELCLSILAAYQTLGCQGGNEVREAVFAGAGASSPSPSSSGWPTRKVPDLLVREGEDDPGSTPRPVPESIADTGRRMVELGVV